MIPSCIFVSLIAVFVGCLSASSVDDVVARLSQPRSISDCTCGANGAYCDGDTINLESMSTVVYYCSSYSSVVSGQQVSIDLMGVSSGNVASGSKRTISGDYSVYIHTLPASLNYFSNDFNIEATSHLYDSSNNIIDSKSITIGFTIESTTVVVSLVSQTANGVTIGNEIIEFNKENKSFESFLSFNCVLNYVKTGQIFEVKVSGAQNGYSASKGSFISGDSSEYTISPDFYVNPFYGNTVLNAQCIIRNSDGTEIDSKTVSVNVLIQ